MKRSKQYAAIVAAVVATALFLGCTPNVEDDPVETTQAQDKGDDHDHHHHDVGPNNGHLIKLKPDDFVAEWTHDDKSYLVAVYILDKEGKNPASIATDHVVIENAIGKDTPVSHELPADELSDEDPPTASRFELKSEFLHTELMMKDGVTSYLRFTIGDKQYEGEIEHIDHTHHHH